MQRGHSKASRSGNSSRRKCGKGSRATKSSSNWVSGDQGLLELTETLFTVGAVSPCAVLQVTPAGPPELPVHEECLSLPEANCFQGSMGTHTLYSSYTLEVKDRPCLASI